MIKKYHVIIFIVLFGFVASMVSPAMAEEEKVLNVYFWFDYLPDSTVKSFEKETGIKVVLDTFESLHTLETKLLAGNSGYDIVVPGAAMAERLINLKTFKALDKSQLSNYGNLDPNILSFLAASDKGNKYGVPYCWGTIGISFNEKEVKARLPEADLRSLDLIFKPENISKISDCGVVVVDDYNMVVPIALNYLGLDPHSVKKEDLEKAEKLLKSIRPYIRHFNSGAIIEELATGEICAALSWSGDAGMAYMRAEELKNDVVVDYSIPKEGTLTFLDFLAIPADAKHPNNAHKFLDYLMKPEVIATVTNEFYYANGNAAALALVSEDVKGDPDIYPPAETMKKLFAETTVPNEHKRQFTRMWTNFKASK